MKIINEETNKQTFLFHNTRFFIIIIFLVIIININTWFFLFKSLTYSINKYNHYLIELLNATIFAWVQTIFSASLVFLYPDVQ